MISQVDHEANISSWVRLARLQNLTIKWWRPDTEENDGSLILTPKNLEPLLSPKTAFVACTHASNVLGGIHDIKALADYVHKEVCPSILLDVIFVPSPSYLELLDGYQLVLALCHCFNDS